MLESGCWLPPESSVFWFTGMTFRRSSSLGFSGTLLVNWQTTLNAGRRLSDCVIICSVSDESWEKAVIGTSDVNIPFFQTSGEGRWRYLLPWWFSASAFISADGQVHQFSTSGADQSGKLSSSPADADRIRTALSRLVAPQETVSRAKVAAFAKWR